MMDPVTIATGAVSVVNAGRSVWDGISGLFGGGGDHTRCAGQPTAEAVSVALRSATPGEMEELRRAFSAANPGEPLPLDPAELSFRAAGGEDCRVSTAGGRHLQSVLYGLVRKYNRGAVPVVETSDGGGSSPRVSVEVETPAGRIGYGDYGPYAQLGQRPIPLSTWVLVGVGVALAIRGLK